MSRISMLFAIALALISAPAGAEIYKWVDEKGNVHYGDCPPPECASSEVSVTPAPSAEAVREADERLRRLRKSEEQAKERSDVKASPSAAVRTEPRDVSGQRDVECLAPLSRAWGGRIEDTREDVSRKPMTKPELRQLTAFFRALEGHWKGTIVKTKCIAPDASPTANIYNFEVRLEGRWVSDDIFRIEANLLGKETRGTSREFFWFLLSPDGLRVRMATTEISAELDEPRYDVSVLDSGASRLALYSRAVSHGGSVRMTTVLSLQRAGRGFVISDFLFSQGICAEKRIWQIAR